MTRPALTIWYNTKCPVCDAGIDRQRNKLVSAIKAATIEFRDINVEPQALAAFGADVVPQCLIEKIAAAASSIQSVKYGKAVMQGTRANIAVQFSQFSHQFVSK